MSSHKNSNSFWTLCFCDWNLHILLLFQKFQQVDGACHTGAADYIQERSGVEMDSGQRACVFHRGHGTVSIQLSGACQRLQSSVGGLSFHGVSGLCMSSLAHGLPGGIQAHDMRRRPMRPGSLNLACDPHALDGDQCGEQRGFDLKHNTTTAILGHLKEHIAILGKAKVVPLTFVDWEPPSLRLTGAHSKVASVQARSAGTVWRKALAMLVVWPARPPR